MRRMNEQTHRPIAPPLEVEGLTFAYTPGVPVLRDVTLTVPPASLTCIIGPNGGGKSTLLRLALGLLEPGCGRIRIFGATPHRACSWVGYVPQQLATRPDFPITVREVVGMGCGRLHRIGAHRRACRDGIEHAMERADVCALRHVSFSQLSGGQRRRVLIARALASGPRLLLLDEPTAGVDPAYNEQFRRLLNELKNDLAVAVVSHDLTFTGPDADQVIFVDRTARRLDPAELDSGWIGRLYRRPDGEDAAL